MLPYVLSYRALVELMELRRYATGGQLVCVDGPGGSGKTSIAEGVAAACERSQVVHVDDFYRPSFERYAGPPAERPVAADFDLSRLRADVLVPLRRGLVAKYHAYDWSTDRVSLHPVSVTQPIVIVEGVYSFSSGLAEFFDFSIWVDCPRDLRLARGLARDGEQARSRWEDDWMPGEDRYVAEQRPQERVALVCDGSRNQFFDDVVVLRDGKVGI